MEPPTPPGAPSSISDVLYLIATHNTDIMSPELLHALSRANLSFVRGAIDTAMSLVNEVLARLDRDDAAYADVVAFRLMLLSLTHSDPLGAMRAELDQAYIDSGPAKVVALCIESNEHWHSGGLFKGLWLNQSAVQHARDSAAVWRLYSSMHIAKKLTDIHISNQAHRVIGEMDTLISASGLHAFDSLPEALRSVLHLQAGDTERALDSAATAVRTARQRVTGVGVKVAHSVAAMANVARGDLDAADADLAAFHAQPSHYVLPDSVARAEIAAIALTLLRDGPAPAAERVRQNWGLLATKSACFVEDLTRPAWLVGIAQRAGETALAERLLDAITNLATANRGVFLLGNAADHARTAFAGERSRPAPVERAAEGEAGSIGERLASLSRREEEIARLVGRGMTNQQVANQLGVSPHTVNFHLRSIFRKLSISTRVKLGQIIAGHDRASGVV